MRGSRTVLLLPLTLLYLPNQTELQSESNSRRDQQQLLPHQATRRISKPHIKAFLQLAIFLCGWKAWNLIRHGSFAIRQLVLWACTEGWTQHKLWTWTVTPRRNRKLSHSS
jgi:hypothetical protein